jgi:TfoX/Sxy family transcriptional regulator of competence genes
MPYSESLAARVRDLVGSRRGISEKKMFGGVGFLLHGNMLVGIWQQSLIVRLGAEQAAAALEEPEVGEFDITGKPMKGWVMVAPDGLDTDDQLRRWIELATEFVRTLPKKQK